MLQNLQRAGRQPSLLGSEATRRSCVPAAPARPLCLPQQRQLCVGLRTPRRLGVLLREVRP